MDAREFDLSDEAPALVTWEVTVEESPVLDDGSRTWMYRVGAFRVATLWYPKAEGFYTEWALPCLYNAVESNVVDAHGLICEVISKVVNDMDSANGLVAVKFPPCPEVE